MKAAQVTVVVRPIKVVTNNAKVGDAWAKIVDVQTGETLHNGQLPYIKKVALKRYNQSVKFI